MVKGHRCSAVTHRAKLLCVCSIASDSISLSQGHLLQDEDSLLSHPDSYGPLGDDKAELLRMLEEASCSSSSSSSSEDRESEEEEEEEEEISE